MAPGLYGTESDVGLHPIAPGLFGTVQGFVGGLNDLLGGSGFSIRLSDSDADGDRERAVRGFGEGGARRAGFPAHGGRSLGATIAAPSIADWQVLTAVLPATIGAGITFNPVILVPGLLASSLAATLLPATHLEVRGLDYGTQQLQMGLDILD